MNIFINNKPADITLDTEKTLGDVLAGIELWISPTGNRIRSISVEGESLPEDALAQAFGREIKDVKKLDITISSWRELAAEALGDLHRTTRLYMDAPFEDRPRITADWGKSPAARFLASDIPDINDLAVLAFSGEGLSTADLAILIDERIREISDPGQEISASEALVKNIAQRMEELPLDIQTGKDHRAAETIQLFARAGEKLFRIIFLLKSQGQLLNTFIIDDLPVNSFINDFNAALKELSAAFENRDTVLVGDIAEYELAPRLLKFYSALKDITKPASHVIPKS